MTVRLRSVVAAVVLVLVASAAIAGPVFGQALGNGTDGTNTTNTTNTSADTSGNDAAYASEQATESTTAVGPVPETATETDGGADRDTESDTETDTDADTNEDPSNGPELNPIGESNGTDGTDGVITTEEPTDREPDITVRSASDLIQAAENAPAGANVYVPSGAMITLEPRQVVFEQRGITLYSDGGRFGEGGATIRMPDEVPADQSVYSMIELRGDSSTVSGLRIIGPHPDLIAAETGSAYEFGISFGLWIKGDDSTVYNTEVAGWSGAGVKFQEAQNGHIYLSNVHHNTDAGTGYGVSSERSWVLIQYNQFDANRHSIQTTRDTESGYRAEGNVQGPRRPNHAFDAHSASKTEAAHGGRRIEIVNNTFLPPSSATDAGGEPMDDPPIELDGRLGPTEGALIANNAFVGIDRDRSVIQNQENGESSDEFANAGDPSEFNNIRLRGNSYADSRAAVPERVGAPNSLPAPGQIRGPDGTTPGGGGGQEGGDGLGIPSASDVAGEAVDGTLSALNEVFVDTVGTILRLPWRLITVRFAPFDGSVSSGEGAWARPPGVYGDLYDLATGRFFQLGVFLLAIFFVIDWLGNFSPKPGVMGVGDRLFRRAGDAAHLAFSWPIAFAHFLFASILCVLFLPPDEVVVSGLTDAGSQLAGIAGAVGFTLIFSVVLAIAGGYLLLKHAGAFLYLLVGLVAYPVLVGASIPEHPIVGRLGDYAESARQGYVVAAWYPVPTTFVLGVGYAVDEAILSALTLGGPLGEISGGAIYYPVLWLAALYAPEKVFKDGGVARKAKRAALAAGTGGAAGATTGSAAGASAGTTAGAAAGASSGTASGLTAGSAAGGSAGALPAGSATAAVGSAGSTASRMTSGSPGASALADGGTRPVATGASGGGGSAGPLGDDSVTGAGGRSGPGSAEATTSGGAGSGQSTPAGTTHIENRSALDTEQRYEPVVQHDSGDLARIGPPKDANWLADKGGFERLDSATDEPLYFRGETDGGVFDLRGAAETGGVHGGAGSASVSGSGVNGMTDADSIRGS